MTVGSNNQNISFFASGDYNETYIYGTDGFCADSYSSGACVTFRGGAYDAWKSSTDKSVSSRKDNTLSFGINTSISSFGFGIPKQHLSQAFTSQSQLSLGKNSSFLQALVSAGNIGTKVYSIFWELVGGPAEKQSRGSLVLGGVDRSLISNPNDNFTASRFRGGRCGTAAIQACISPRSAGLMTLPLSYYDNFKLITGGTPPDNRTEARSLDINYFTMLFEPSNVYYGGLTIQLPNSISLKIPNTELVVPDTYIASNSAVQTNTSVRNVVINSLQSYNGNDLPVLGRLFMSSAYTMVNQEAGRFSVWQANTGSRTLDVVAVDKQNNMISEFCTNSTGRSIDAAPSPTSSLNILVPTNEASKLSGGLIGGIIVGVLGGLVLLGAIGFILYRRRRLGNAATKAAQKPESQMITDVKSSTLVVV
ncbi:hypothetical protein COCMIDRAFT_40423 [Bipolaris oryzae ATCC 44560]|uniref:Peptidase A1 domain-containing protein n=1 Tax=Bipolaris oryzae ATCC 44560 TaxID=930090 RepID=W6YUZ9_COCMI|nr:uncharacterized protein COCMIDRAFT_40423 [Bipolaris oryzae ATCC 44560]EUC41383.1 hypothetical protein COCMIDRAFT_40423 [Bipolaris oryzae ATCC 44560]